MPDAGPSPRTPLYRRPGFWILLVVLGLALSWGGPTIGFFLGIPRTVTESGPIVNFPGRDPAERTIQFSPDGRYLAYLHQEATYQSSARIRGLTMCDAIQVHWFPVDRPDAPQTAALDAVDLRPDGVVYYCLTASIAFAPDSRHLAAWCARTLLVIDPASGATRRLHYDKEFFGSLAWQSGEEFIFTTQDGDHLTFWRLNLAEADGDRHLVYREAFRFPSPTSSDPHKDLPPDIARDSWSPDGRFVIFDRCTPNPQEGLLDVTTGTVRTFPFSLFDHSWKPDGSAVFVLDGYHPPNQRALLIETADGRICDLTESFKTALGTAPDLTLAAPTWTPDGKYVLLYHTTHLPPPSPDRPGSDLPTGYVIQPQPFKVILKSDRYLRWSPMPGWVLRQGTDVDLCDWINYEGTTTVRVKDWPNSWTWSPDRKHAAQVVDHRVTVFEPRLPTP